MGNKSNGESQVKGTVLVTGASDFVGHYLCERLLDNGLQVRGTLLEFQKV